MRIVYRRAAAVIVIDPFFVDSIHEAEAHARVFPVRNGIDLTPFENAERNDALLTELGVPAGAKVVMYAGNVGRSQALDSVIAATKEVGCQLVIHGGGATLDAVRSDVERRGLTHVHFSTFRPREELGMLFASADVHVVPLKPGIATSSVPSKLLSIFAAGRPAVVVAEEDSPTAAVLNEAGGGWLVPPEDDAALTAALHHALADDADRAERAAKGQAWVRRMGGTERTAAEYEAVLAGVAQGF
jgi:colanic acid biosynthesis glycosyl transferase WcaI